MEFRSWLALLGAALAVFGLALGVVISLRGEVQLLSLDREASLILVRLIGFTVLAITIACLTFLAI